MFPSNGLIFIAGIILLHLLLGGNITTSLIICPEITEVPSDFIEQMPKNVTVIPKVESNKMPALYQRSKFFIRYTQHDGISLRVLEALYFNLEVLWTYEFLYPHKIDTLEKLSESIPSLVNNGHPNERGHAFVVENYSIQKWKVDFFEILKK